MGNGNLSTFILKEVRRHLSWLLAHPSKAHFFLEPNYSSSSSSSSSFFLYFFLLLLFLFFCKRSSLNVFVLRLLPPLPLDPQDIPLCSPGVPLLISCYMYYFIYPSPFNTAYSSLKVVIPFYDHFIYALYMSRSLSFIPIKNDI